MKTILFNVFALFIPLVVLLVVSLGYIAVFLKTLFESPSGLLPLMLLGLPLGLLWLLWIEISSLLRAALLGKNSRGNRR